MGNDRNRNAERAAATRDALLAATLDLLVERGWAGITSVAVCARAGLTRGAFVHHFPDGLPDLFAAALESRYAEVADVAHKGPRSDSIETLLRRSWEGMVTSDFKVVIEAWLAAANDADLARTLGPVVERFAKVIHPEQRADVLADESARAFYFVARESLIGLALGRATNRGLPLSHESIVLDQLTELARMHDVRLGHTSFTQE